MMEASRIIQQGMKRAVAEAIMPDLTGGTRMAEKRLAMHKADCGVCSTYNRLCLKGEVLAAIAQEWQRLVQEQEAALRPDK